MPKTSKKYNHPTSMKKRLLPTREEQRNALELSMLSLLKRTRTTLQHFNFCAPLVGDIQAVLERYTEYENGRPSQKHLKDAVRPGTEEEEDAA